MLQEKTNFLNFAALRCSQNSKRIRAICHDESLWRSISIFRRKVPSSFLEKIIDNGCKHLSLLYASFTSSKLALYAQVDQGGMPVINAKVE